MILVHKSTVAKAPLSMAEPITMMAVMEEIVVDDTVTDTLLYVTEQVVVPSELYVNEVGSVNLILSPIINLLVN